MKIHLHIERLVMDGLSLARRERPLLLAAVEAELAGLLAQGGLGDSFRTSGAFYEVRTTGIQLVNSGNSAGLGRQIAGAVYGGLGK